MNPVLSVAVPAHNEERYIGRCIESILSSAQRAKQPVEVVVALNRCTDRTGEIAASLGARCTVEDRRCLAAVRNAAVRASSTPAIATLDADSWMAGSTVSELLDRVYDLRYIGGGSLVRLERWSPGIAFSFLAIAPYLIGRCISLAMFWCLRETFEKIGGFNEDLVSVEDLDFALRLKALGRREGRQYGTIWRGAIGTSCRKFDSFGDWYLFKNPRLVHRLFSGKDRAAADGFYYDASR